MAHAIDKRNTDTRIVIRISLVDMEIFIMTISNTIIMDIQILAKICFLVNFIKSFLDFLDDDGSPANLFFFFCQRYFRIT